MQEFILNFCSASAAYTIVYPIDVIKTQYQVARVQNVNENMLNLIKNVYVKQGFKGYYTGLNVQLLSHPIYWSAFFSTNRFIEKKIHGTLNRDISLYSFILKNIIKNT